MANKLNCQETCTKNIIDRIELNLQRGKTKDKTWFVSWSHQWTFYEHSAYGWYATFVCDFNLLCVVFSNASKIRQIHNISLLKTCFITYSWFSGRAPRTKIKKCAFLTIKDLVWPFSHTQFAFEYCWFVFFAWPPCILRKFLQFEAESWPAPRRRLFELPVFRTVAEIRGFFAAIYEKKEYQQTLFKNSNILTNRLYNVLGQNWFLHKFHFGA